MKISVLIHLLTAVTLMSLTSPLAAGQNAAEPATAMAEPELSDRVKAERVGALNPYVILAHKHNYLLPLSYTSVINVEEYEQNDVALRSGLLNEEVKFQISLKTQLNENDMFLKNDNVFLSITIAAWWQLYSSDLSSPFRETNYQPEIFYRKPLVWRPFGGLLALTFGLEHQSNGQVQGLSRSWNRVYAEIFYERDQFVFLFKPWYRLPEKSKRFELDPKGDDNPDILDFMGHGEVMLGWRNERYELKSNMRLNTATNKGALRVGATFPLFGKFRGFVEYFNGYGDSLIDYDHFQQRLGLGVALTNLH